MAKRLMLYFILLIVMLLLSSCAGGQSFFPANSPLESTATPSPITTKTRLPTVTPSITPTPTQIITIEPYTNVLPYEWGELRQFSVRQVSEAKNCNVEVLANKYYSGDLEESELIYRHKPETACEWAALAYAYARLSHWTESVFSETAKDAFAQTIIRNPALILTTPMYCEFVYENIPISGAFPVIEQPPLPAEEITNIRIQYEMEDEYGFDKYDAEIRDANTEPYIYIRDYQRTWDYTYPRTIRPKYIQALGNSLTNLIPIESPFTAIRNADEYMNWIVTITYSDGTDIVMSTYKSQLFGWGGPWQINLNGQIYVQYSAEFLSALLDLINHINLMTGEIWPPQCEYFNFLELTYPSIIE